MNDYGSVLSLISHFVGFAGFIFGVWRVIKERKLRRELEASRHELDAARDRLKHLEGFASGLKQYSAAV
jgi:uncharacterized membrane protein YqjE